MEFPSEDKPVIIAIKGLPFSGAVHVQCNIAAWARSCVFRLVDFLMELYKDGGYSATSRPTTEEDERLQRLAFSTLCQAAKRQLRIPKIKLDCVIVDCGLSSTSQLDGLIRMAADCEVKLLIIECQRRHKYIWQIRAQDGIHKYKSVWFIPKSWNEVEKAIEDYDAKAWDQHYHLQCSAHPHLHLKRMVFDPINLRRNELIGLTTERRISAFAKAIEYLLTDEAAPPVVDFSKWRKQHVERLLTLSTNHLCSNNVGDCIFTYMRGEADAADRDEANNIINIINCRACDKQVNIISSEEGAYACASCNLTLHKSCAEFPTHHRLYNDRRPRFPRLAYGFPQRHACKTCTGQGKAFSYECRGCIFETHLKCRRVPTVVNNPHLHPHPLSILLTTHTQQYQGTYQCELCSAYGYLSSYYCIRCNLSYHLRCVHSPVQLDHEHQGYRHLMKLMVPNDHDDDKADLQPQVFSSEQYVDQDDFWCDFCFKEIDQDAAYYSCQECPDCVAHIYCISPLWEGETV